MITCMKICGAASSLAVMVLFAQNASAEQPKGSNVIAIDVLIEPDAVMVDNAKAVNARLRQDYPGGYAFDSNHAPHITLVQRFVRAGDLDAIAGVVTRAMQSGPALPIALTATGYGDNVWAGVGIVSYKMERAPELLELANKIESAIRPFTVSGGTADAFSKADGEQISAETVKYVEAFVPASSGQKYMPHVTLGIAHPDFAKALATEPFRKFAFKGVNVAVYQLGNFGTAQKKLWAWRAK
jgi:2'-5' RNA ligase